MKQSICQRTLEGTDPNDDLRSNSLGGLICPVCPPEDSGSHAVPRSALRAMPVPTDAMEPTVIALIPATSVCDARQQSPERRRVGSGINAGVELAGDRRQLANILWR